MVLVGTTKGAFLYRSRDRKTWRSSGPLFKGQAVYALAYDPRGGRRRIWAGTANYHFGSVLCHSDDLGASWTVPDAANIRFPEDTGAALKQIWQITPGRAEEPDVVYVGVDPAALFESRDGGATFALVRGLYNHEHRARWQPGFGGLCLHTILPHPTDSQRMHVAISAAGVYRTDDGGKTWRTSHKGVRAEFMPDKHPEFGQCVHKVVRDPQNPERMFLQNHWGLYRSDDGGDSWADIAKGVPSDFGFAMAAHPRDAETAYIVPLEADAFRCTPDGKLRVFRTRRGGEWEPLGKGLPQKNAFETVLRDGLSVDALHPAGVYFGTRSGKVYGSSDEGGSWSVVAEGLPPVTCVKVATLAVGERIKARARSSEKAMAKGQTKAKTKAKAKPRTAVPSRQRPKAKPAKSHSRARAKARPRARA
jgi:photosystem II stability/assembly factor-like uncharacterized protein